MEFIPRVSPRWESPQHLRAFVDVLEAAPYGGLRVCISTPPQHGKTELVLHFISLLLKKHPALRSAYVTYNGPRTARVSRNARNIAERAFVNLSGSSLGLWTTPEGGQMLWTSMKGGLTGEPVDGVLVIDDPLAGRDEAESATVRQNQIDWFHGTADSRVHPGASIIVIMTRWHVNDLAGYLVKKQGFTYLNFKAICDGVDMPPHDHRQVGEALWESRRPLANLQKTQLANIWNFASLFQGSPQPRGGQVFKAPTYYRTLPTEGFKVCYGVDLAYSEKSRADWSVLVTLWVVPPPKTKRDEVREKTDYLFYVTDVQRKQVEAPSFALVLKAAYARHRSRFYWYASGTEAGAAQFIREKHIPLVVMDPRGRDKLTRAQTTSELWNLGRIMVPDDAHGFEWQPIFIDEITTFTGASNDLADQTDAMVSGVDAALAFIDDLGVLGSGGRYT